MHCYLHISLLPMATSFNLLSFYSYLESTNSLGHVRVVLLANAL